jgi:hypothetical protein
MAGLSADQVVVDVLAAAALLVPEHPTQPPAPLEPAPGASADAGMTYQGEPALCMLGHQNPPGVRFCASCGVSMSARPPSAPVQERPKPSGQLTAEERIERERLHAEAVSAAARFEQAPVDYRPVEGEAVLIHFTADGLTAFGQVWYRGQELQIGPGHPRWEEARGWITLDRWQQIERWGMQKFDFGPWPGRRSYTEAAGGFQPLTVTAPDGSKVRYDGPTAEELAQADAAEALRGRAVPAPAVL